MKLREGSVFTGVFHSVWGSYVATTHDALDFSELPLLQTWDLTVQRPFKIGTSLYKDPLCSGDIWRLLKHMWPAQAGSTHLTGMLSCSQMQRHELTESKGAQSMSF